MLLVMLEKLGEEWDPESSLGGVGGLAINL